MLRALLLFAIIVAVYSSSHSEAPGTTTSPRSDLTDFYAFTSYETGRSDYVTFLMNVNPMQESFGGPNYSPLPSDFVFNVHIDNTGDAIEDLTFQFIPGANFSGTFNPATGIHDGLTVPVNGRNIKVPLAHIGQVNTQADEGVLNFKEHYQLRVFNGPAAAASDVDAGPFAMNGNSRFFRKPFDYAGTKSFPNYQTYANSFIHTFTIPGATGNCATRQHKVFVGQRRESFSVNLGQIFDLINVVPVAELGGTNDPRRNVLSSKAVTTFALEIHKDCVRGAAPNNAVIGSWASVQHLAHNAQGGHVAGAQKNRLANPLVNEVIIGLTDKNKFNLNHPSRDSQFQEYFDYPVLPELIEILWGAATRTALNIMNASQRIVPTFWPRSDLTTILLQGVPTVNQQTVTTADATCNPPVVAATPGPMADLLRLNLNTAPVPQAQQKPIAIIDNVAPLTDTAGWPNGRRPGDDTVDIALRAVMGRLCTEPFSSTFNICTPSQAIAGNFSITDRAPQSAMDFDAVFPYLKIPLPGNDHYRDGTAPDPNVPATP